LGHKSRGSVGKPAKRLQRWSYEITLYGTLRFKLIEVNFNQKAASLQIGSLSSLLQDAMEELQEQISQKEEDSKQVFLTKKIYKIKSHT
jgi:hypothetical protein